MDAMTIKNLHGRHFLKELDFTPAELCAFLDLAARLKEDRRAGRERQFLQGKNIVLLFEKDSTRTRCAFEVAAHDQGAHVTCLGPTGSQMGKKESLADTARVLAGFFDGIEYRGFGQERVEKLAACSQAPVWNGLTNEWHPTQFLADMLTMRENCPKPLSAQKLAYLGDARYNTGNSLMIGCALLGIDFRSIGPRQFWTDDCIHGQALEIAKKTGAKIMRTENINEGVRDCDFVYTDVWLSMGEPETDWGARIAAMQPYRVTREVMRATGNDAAGFLHCLPAFHDCETSIAAAVRDRYGIECMEVENEVFESPRSLVFEEAANRMHTIKAVMAATLAGDRLAAACAN